MAIDDRQDPAANDGTQRAVRAAGSGRTVDRDKYRDNDDVRAPTPPELRNESKPDTKFEARGDARENIGNTARGTAADPIGPEGNDRQRGRPQTDEFDADLEADNRRTGGGR
jgi:hypothetical protein